MERTVQQVGRYQVVAERISTTETAHSVERVDDRGERIVIAARTHASAVYIATLLDAHALDVYTSKVPA